MAAQKIDLVIEKGATFRWPLRLSAGGVPMSLTGYKARMQVRESVAAPTTVLDLSTENGAITFDENLVLVVASDEATELVTASRGVYDLELEYPNGEVDRLFEGKVTFKPSVTR